VSGVDYLLSGIATLKLFNIEADHHALSGFDGSLSLELLL
jgi:hypothetical protein